MACNEPNEKSTNTLLSKLPLGYKKDIGWMSSVKMPNLSWYLTQKSLGASVENTQNNAAQKTTGKGVTCVIINSIKKRIRVAKHPLQIHLLFAVRAHLLLSDDAPSSYAELMEPGFGVKAQQ